MLEQTTVSAPARLHFGLFSVGNIAERKFGGIGLMIQQPRTVIQCSPAERFEVSGPSANDVRKTVQCWFQKLGPELKSQFEIESLDEMPFRLNIESLPTRHSGFGSGTQLALASVAALGHAIGLPAMSPEEMAATLDRGKRSAIGTYGFFRGGFLVDRGKHENETLAPLDFQSSFPEDWDIVLVSAKNSVGVSGVQEVNAFEKIPPTSEQHRAEMIEIVKSDIIPGVLQRNYNQFAAAVTEFGFRSGLMFDSIQGGAYQNDSIEKLVNQIREFGVNAVGQSSWGPCVFAISENAEQTRELTTRLTACYGSDLEITITKADNRGSLTSGELSKTSANTLNLERQ